MALSPGQQKWYRQLVNAAYAEEARFNQGDLPTKEEWRRGMNVRLTGYYSTSQMNKTDDFDVLMLELAIMAQHDKSIAHFIDAAERRVKYVIEKQFLPDLEYLEGQKIDWKYIQGICNRMNVPNNLLDCTAEQLLKVLWALDSHVRRKARNHKPPIELIDLPSGYFRKGFRAEAAKAKWHHDHHHHITHGAAA